MTSDLFTLHELERLRAAMQLADIEFHQQLGSTNDRGLQLAARADVALPLLVLAAQQTAGRGQRARSWWSAPGALTFSLVLQAAPQAGPGGSREPVSILGGLAVARVVGGLLPAAQVGLKWPNDVLIQQRKVAGILVESLSAGGSSARNLRHVVGFGINVNNTHRDAPAEIRDQAIALRDAAGSEMDLTEVLSAVIRQLAQLRAQFAVGQLDLPTCWRSYCVLEGREITLESSGRTVAGVCHGIDRDGALLLEGSRGPTRHISGSVARTT